MNRGVPIWVQIILPASSPAPNRFGRRTARKKVRCRRCTRTGWAFQESAVVLISHKKTHQDMVTGHTISHDQLYKKWGWKPGWYPCAALPICLGLKLEIAALICSASSGIFFVQFLKSVLWVCTWIAIKTCKNNLIFICSNPSWHWPLQLWPRLFHHNGIPVYRIPRFMKKEQCHCDFGFKIGGLASAVGEEYTVHSHVMGNFTTIQY